MRKLFTTLIFTIFSIGLFAQLDGVNLALNKPVTSSSELQAASNAVDGNYGTRWESAFSDNQWISIDLENRYVIDTILIFWEAVVTSANPGVIQGSYDGNYWWDIIEFGVTDDDKVDTLLVEDTTRFVRMTGIHRNGPWGYSPYEIEVYGTEEITALYADSLSVTPENSNLDFGETVQFAIAGFDQNDDAIALTSAEWSVNNGGSINSTGLFTANKIGDFKITVVSHKISDTAIVSVTSTEAIPSSIVIAPQKDTLTEGETTQFTAVVYDQDNNPVTADVEWSTKFNTIDQNGLFTGDYTGDNLVIATVNYTIGAVSGSFSDSAIVSVFPSSTQNIALLYESAGAASEQQSADFAVDNNYNSRWEPAAGVSDMSWVVKLDTIYDLGAIVIDWEVAGAQSYDIQVSNDSANWTTIYYFNPENIVRSLANHDLDSLPVNGNAQFVRFVGNTRTFNPYGPSFWEFKIYPAANSTLGVSRIEIAPETSTIDEGGNVQFSYTAYNPSNEEIQTTVDWSVLEANANITDNGLFSSIRSGNYHVVVASGEIADTAIVTVNDISVIDSIEVLPNDVNITEGETQQFEAIGYDQFGLEFEFIPSWSVSGGGNIDASGLFTATTAGSFYVKAENGTVSDSVLIVIAELPRLDSISVTTSSESVVEGETLQFEAAGYDQFGNSFVFTAEWFVNGGGSIDANGLFTATTPGEFYVKAYNNSIADSVFFTVTDAPELDSISVSPKENSIYVAQTIQFTANGFDQFGESFVFTPGWSVTGGGTIDENGLFTANSSGEFYVKASSGDVVDSVLVTISDAPALETLEVTPENVTISLGSTQQFTATGTDQYGNPIDIDVTWYVTEGANITTGGLFSTETAGEYTVTAQQGDVSATATVMVEGGDGTGINLLNPVVVFPNPALDMVSISIGENTFNEIEIVNTNGTIVYSQELISVSEQVNIDITSLESGIYFIRLINSKVVTNTVFTKQ